MRLITTYLTSLLFVCGTFVAAFGQQTGLFEYEHIVPAVFKEKSVDKSRQVIVRDIIYASPKGGMVTAFLIEPLKTKGKIPAVIFLHGAGADKNQFLDEAVRLAGEKGIASLIFDAPSARPAPWKKSEYDALDSDREMRIQSVVDARRAFDMLENLPQVDASRIGFVGYSYGASIGGVLAGVDRRFKTFVLMASGGSQMDFWLNEDNLDAVELKKNLKPEQFEKFIEFLKPLEQNDYIKNAAPASVFFQFPKRDEFSRKGDFEKFFAAASEPKKAVWYDAAHALNAEAAKDRSNWLVKKLAKK